MHSQEIVEKPLVRENNKKSINIRSSSNTGNYDVKYHRLELRVDPAIKYIAGNITTYFVPVSGFNSMYFDFRNNMSVDSVKYHNNNLNHSFSNSTELKIDFLSTLAAGVLDSVTVFYHGVPLADGFGSFKTRETTCSTQDSVMWTLSEPYGAKNWWPCKEVLTDKIDSIDMLVTANKKYHIGSNGLLVSRDTIGNKITDHWKHKYPIPAYLVAFAASEYSIYRDTIDLFNGGDLEVLNYVFPCDSSLAHQRTRDLDTVMNFFIKKFGAYPYENEKYGHAQCRFGGGMEHTSMTFMGGWWYYVLIHELAHQWFGDKITCGSWEDIWLNEGFATYLEGLTCEEGIQSTSFHDWLAAKRSTIIGVTNGSVFCDDTTSVSRIFNGRLSYNKGAYLLHMLRWVVGDDDFFEGVYNYINDPVLSYDYALTEDFKAHMEIASDTILGEFFEDWYYGEGWPNYDIEWSVDNTCNNKLRVSINQNHSMGEDIFFEMPVPVRFSAESNDTLIVFNQFSPEDTLFIKTIDFEPTAAVFDPELWLCAPADINKVGNSIRTIHWTGAVNNLWNVAGNWDCGIPTSLDEVIIPNGTPDCIIFKEEIGNCKRLWIEDGATVITVEGAQLNVGD